MMTIIKKIMLALFCVLMASFIACTEKDKIITMSELPDAAQTFLQTYFEESDVSVIKKEIEALETNYDVIMKDGSQIEFDKNGKWTEVKSITKAVPDAIIPSTISNYVKQNYPNDYIMSIDEDRAEYELHLSNNLELTFNKQGKLIDMD